MCPALIPKWPINKSNKETVCSKLSKYSHTMSYTLWRFENYSSKQIMIWVKSIQLSLIVIRLATIPQKCNPCIFRWFAISSLYSPKFLELTTTHNLIRVSSQNWLSKRKTLLKRLCCSSLSELSERTIFSPQWPHCFTGLWFLRPVMVARMAYARRALSQRSWRPGWKWNNWQGRVRYSQEYGSTLQC